MRVMVFVPGNKDSEAGQMPSQELIARMTKFNEELVKAGVPRAASGTRQGLRDDRTALTEPHWRSDSRLLRPSRPPAVSTVFRTQPWRASSALVIVALALAGTGSSSSSAGRDAAEAATAVSVTRDDAARRVDIAVGGAPFASYIYPASLKKPVLYPLRTAKGTIVTRGFPLDPRQGERTDHPHQVGAWFTYGDVNGIDFWGYSDATPAGEVPQKGTIRHKAVTRTANGANRGELSVTADWVMPDGSVILAEETRFIFRGTEDSRTVDRVTRWIARGTRVVFRDTKEGAFGIRVARSLEHPSSEPEVFTDRNGQPTTVPRLDHTGVTGIYRSSEGQTGEQVWGTRARWMMLTGTVDREPVTLAILDHPANIGFPTYWHARGYGLFAANPFGQAALSNAREQLNFSLEPGRAVVFRHRILVLSGTASPQRIESEHHNFASAVS